MTNTNSGVTYATDPMQANVPPIGSVNLPSSMNQRYRYARPGFGPYGNPAQPGISAVSATGELTYEVPKNYAYPKNQFFDFVSAMIRSSSAKIVADPTLLVQESESSSVGVGTTVFTNCSSSTSANGTQNFQPTKETAGLQVNVDVKRIDDNGFISLKVNPVLKAPAGVAVTVNCGGINLPTRDLSVRELRSGEFRVRDGQTLILTGVIQDEILEAVDKWPVLGDLPLIGQFFRNSSGNRKKKELVMVVTPSIVNDAEGGLYGYGYQPSTKDAKKLIYQP